MQVDNSKNQGAFIELLSLLKEKSSVFCYKSDSKARGFATMLAQEIQKEDNLPVIRICWNENEQENHNFPSDTCSFYIFRNYTTSLIQIQKKISRKKYLIVVSDISKLEEGQNSRPYLRFLSILLRKSEEYGSTMITTIDSDSQTPLIRSELIPHFNNYYLIENGKLIIDNKEIPNLKYSIRDDRLYLEPVLQDDLNKIKEIFSLTAEEKKELDKIVGQSFDEYRTSL